MACAAILRGHSEVTLRCHLDNKSRNSFGLDHKRMPVEALFIKPSSGLDCGIRSCFQTCTKVWSCFDALSNKYHQSVFQQVLLLTIDILLWSSLLHLLLFTNPSPYRRCCCVCVFAKHLRWHRLVSLGFEHVPLPCSDPPFLLSISPTAVCFCHPICRYYAHK